ncbi:MAG TPA: hypothetical protein VFU06_01860 [Longimicrobiales bacterium]|nr:hypothetical protein [Longimicrobiales bacterium]
MKWLLVILIVLGFAWSVPAGRERIRDVLQPVGEQLEPVLNWALDPMRRAGARRELDFILRAIENERQMGRPFPNPATFHEWVGSSVDALNDGLDPWGQPYTLEVSRQTATVVSAGPDRTRGTADDVKASRSFGR